MVRHDGPDRAVLHLSNLSALPADISQAGIGSRADTDIVADHRYDGCRWLRLSHER